MSLVLTHMISCFYFVLISADVTKGHLIFFKKKFGSFAVRIPSGLALALGAPHACSVNDRCCSTHPFSPPRPPALLSGHSFAPPPPIPPRPCSFSPCCCLSATACLVAHRGWGTWHSTRWAPHPESSGCSLAAGKSDS